MTKWRMYNTSKRSMYTTWKILPTTRLGVIWVARRSLRIRDTVTFLPCFVCLSSSSLRYASDCSVIPRYLLLLDSSLLTLTAPPLCNTVVVFCPTLSLRHTRVCATTLHSFPSLFSPIVDLSDCFFFFIFVILYRSHTSSFLLSFLLSHFCFICTYYSVIQGFSVLVCVCVYGVPRYSAFLALV